jgi:hypothetical protein
LFYKIQFTVELGQKQDFEASEAAVRLKKRLYAHKVGPSVKGSAATACCSGPQGTLRFFKKLIFETRHPDNVSLPCGEPGLELESPSTDLFLDTSYKNVYSIRKSD